MTILELITVIGIAVGLAMDAFAVSIVSGSAYRTMCVRCALRMAFSFGAFQAVMPLLGYLAGNTLVEHIEKYDHWIAFGLLVGIGGKMIYEAIKTFNLDEGEKSAKDPSCPVTLVVLSIATSIDALAVGVTLSLITQHIYATVILIGVITFALSYIGCEIGKRMGHFFEKKIEIVGGLILIGIGAKILISHLFYT